MLRQSGQMPAAEASRFLQRLCFHFSRKITVAYDAQQGHAEFPWGQCRLTAQEEALVFDCSAAAAEQLERVRFVIDAHVRLFSRRTPLCVAWQDIQG